jgi:hypothetical protein
LEEGLYVSVISVFDGRLEGVEGEGGSCFKKFVDLRLG